MRVTTELVMATPGLATSWLQHIEGNRPFSKQYAESIAGAMMRGEWKLNGETIKFAANGRQLDGQHRTRALASLAEVEGAEKIKVPFLVVRNVDDAAFDTIDQGRKRRPSDVLHIMGEVNVTNLAAAARAIHFVRRATGETGNVTAIQIEHEIASHPTIRDWVRIITGGHGAGKIVTPGRLAAVVTLGAEEFGDELAMSFVNGITTGESLGPGSPILALRDKFIEHRRSRSAKLPTYIQLPLIIKAWNAHVLGKKVHVLKFLLGESFPELVRKR